MNLVLFLGAGFSVPAGLPAGDSLFQADLIPHSKKANRDIDKTLSAWRAWRAQNPDGRAEQFISAIYESESTGELALWPSLVRFVGYRLANPFATFYRYDGRTSRSRDNIFEAKLCDAHKAWWDAILILGSGGCTITVVTPNWDIWIERALRPRPTPRLHRPGFHYGWGTERLKATTAYPRSRWRENPSVSGTVPVLKLHGSLSWAVESGQLIKYGDLRPAFRGDAAIVPPIRNKISAPWGQDLWRKARFALTAASHVLVVGYSFPEYDQRLNRLFGEAMHASPADVHVFDPDADRVCDRANRMLGRVRASPHAGLPEGIADVAQIFSENRHRCGSRHRNHRDGSHAKGADG